MSKKTIKIKKPTFVLSPLALLTLAACGGGGGGGQSGGGGGSFSVGGNVIKGPLSNALVGLDYDGDGIVDSNTVRTDFDGSYSISTSSSTYTIIAVTDDATVDASSGTVLSGVTLKAPQGASVVTPTTTLMKEGNLTSEQVASVLGLPDGVDPTTFNPYDSGVDATKALAVEKASQQVMTVMNSFASSAEGAGASEADAFKAALNSVVEVVKAKANKLSDPNANDADKSLDLTNATDLALIKTQAISEVSSTSGVNATAFNALVDDTATAVKNVNDKIATVSDLTSDASKNVFSTTQVLADQVKTAAIAEASSAGSGNITFTDANVVSTAASNNAPTDITLSSSSISEAASSLAIGTLSATDSDQTSSVPFTYKLAGADSAAFSLNQATGGLSLRNQPDHETKSSYSITVLSTDEGGKTFSKAFTITTTDANDAPIVANAIADQTIAEDSALSFKFASDVFADVDLGDSLTYTAALSNDAALPSWLSFDASTGTFSGTPANADVGSIDVKVMATDGSAASASDTFALNVTNTNDAPNFPILSASYVEENAAGSILGDVSSIDLDGDKVTFSLASGGDNSHFEIIGDKLKLLDVHSADFEGKNTYSITVIASDGIVAAEKTFEIAVVNKPDAPSDALAQLNIKYIDERIFDQYTSSLETVDAQFKELDKSLSTQLNNFNSYVDLHQDNASLTVSSKGFTIDYGDYELVANFATFSPNSLSELQQLQNIDAQDSSTWIIDGGFSDIVIKNTSGDLVKLMLDSDGLSLTSETVSTGDLSGIRLDGTFSNQVSDLLTFTDYYSKIDSTSGNTAVSHIDDLRAFANGKFELTGISLLREGATDVAASVNYGNDTLTLSLEKFELSASVQNLSDVVDFTSLELRDNYFNSSVIDLFDDISGDSTSASLILNHDDHGSLLNLQIEDLNKLENVTIGSSNTFGMLDGNHYAVDENFTLATYVDFGGKVLDTSAFTSYFNNLDELSNIYVEII